MQLTTYSINDGSSQLVWSTPKQVFMHYLGIGIYASWALIKDEWHVASL